VNTGVAHCVGDWIRAQKASGWDVVVACPGGMLAQRALQEGARVVQWDAVREPGAATFGETRRLARIIDEVDPDIVHLHTAKAGLGGRLVIRGRRPTVFSPHAWSYVAVRGRMRGVTLRWERFATRWAHAIVCVSEAERDRGRRDGIRARFEVYPNEVDLSDFPSVLAQTPEQSRAGLGFDTRVPLAICVARLAVQKGQDVLLDAWPQVRREVPDARLMLIGEGPRRAEIEQQAAGVEGVEILGALGRESTLRWMNAASVVVCPSRWEGMSLVPLEARSLGRPVVATEVDGIRETFPEGGAGVEIVAVDDSDALIGPLVRALRGEIAPVEGSVSEPGQSASRLVALYGELVDTGS
jgi:glycosyltransferase involved in cell wall biosynthesis